MRRRKRSDAKATSVYAVTRPTSTTPSNTAESACAHSAYTAAPVRLAEEKSATATCGVRKRRCTRESAGGSTRSTPIEYSSRDPACAQPSVDANHEHVMPAFTASTTPHEAPEAVPSKYAPTITEPCPRSDAVAANTKRIPTRTGRRGRCG